MPLFALNSSRVWRRTSGFSNYQFGFHCVLVVKHRAWAVNPLQKDFSGGSSHLSQGLAHGG